VSMTSTEKLKALTDIYSKLTGEIEVIGNISGGSGCDAIHTDPNDANKVFLVTGKDLIRYDTKSKTERTIINANSKTWITSFNLFKNGGIIVCENKVGTYYLSPTDGDGMYGVDNRLKALEGVGTEGIMSSMLSEDETFCIMMGRG